MKKLKPIFFLIEGTIYPFDTLICLATHEEVIRYIEKNKKYKLSDEEKDKLAMTGSGRTVMLFGGQTIIRLKREKTKIGFNLDNFVHEISHATFFLMDRIGVKHTFDSDEAFAYYQAYLMRKCLNYFDK